MNSLMWEVLTRLKSIFSCKHKEFPQPAGEQQNFRVS